MDQQDELRGLVRIGYISITRDNHPEDTLLRSNCLIFFEDPPNTPYYKVHITVVETELRYKHERIDCGGES